MEESKKRIVVISLAIIIVIVVASIGIYLFKGEASVEGITALEGRVSANSIAQEWNSSAHLVGVRMSGQHEGYADPICYTYTNSTLGQIPVFFYEVYYNANLTYEINTYTFYSPNGEDTPIVNWTIDSNDAFDIAKDNPEIAQFLRHNPMVDGVQLSAQSGIPTWYILWTYDAGFDNPKSAQIKIDATTGEVLYVDADN